MIGRVALLVTFEKAKPKSQSLSRSHIRDLSAIAPSSNSTSSLLQRLGLLEPTLLGTVCSLYPKTKLKLLSIRLQRIRIT